MPISHLPRPGARLRSAASALTVLAVLVAPASAATAQAGPPTHQAATSGARTTHAAHFQVATFNVLGRTHTDGHPRSGYSRSASRMSTTVRLMRSHGIDVAGFQEFELAQHQRFHELRPHWSAFPTRRQGQRAAVNAVVWDRSVWKVVKRRTIAIPYFRGDEQRMPYVLLRHRATGRKIWFSNLHAPADVHGEASQWRREAIRREARLTNRLHRTGRPVILTGDMNDREKFFCPMTRASVLHAANGGTRNDPCRPPAHMDVDWLMGSPRVRFSGFDSVRDVHGASDHPFVYATAAAR